MISNIFAREIIDSRGNPTISVKVYLSSGEIGESCVPSGASTGLREAVELRDNDPKRYGGKGMLRAIKYVNTEIKQALVGKNPLHQEEIDKLMINLDGTSNKERLGANSVLAVSIAVARAAAKKIRTPLYRYLNKGEILGIPLPMMNILNGGVHANNNLDFQEFMIIPIGAPNFHEAVRYGSEIFHSLRKILTRLGLSTAVGNEGGFAPNLKNNEEAINLILESIEKAGYEPGKEVALALDVASSEFFLDGNYYLESNKSLYSSEDFINLLETLTKKYPIFSIEDGMSENDWKGWKELTNRLGKDIQLVGDDVFVTNPKIISEGVEGGIANSVLIKPNQIGTITETLSAIEKTKEAGYSVVISHRSGETEDTTISDLSVAVAAEQIKAGSLSCSDRVSKYNRLMEIESEIAKDSGYLRRSKNF